MNPGIIPVAAVVAAAVVFAVTLAVKSHLGEQRQQVAFILALTVAAVVAGAGLLAVVIGGAR